jgi:lipopolysaccharide heptosyltransferase II
MPKKILIIRFSSIGDIVLTTPVVRCLKSQLSEVKIHFLTKEIFKPILEHNPYLDKLHLLNKENKKQLIKELKQESFDCIIDLHKNLRTTIFKWKLKRPSIAFKKLNLEKYLLVKFKINKLPKRHIVDRYMETVKSFGVKNDGKGLDYFIDKRDEVDLKALPEPFRKGYIGFVLGASYKTKQYPVDRVVEICNALDEPILLFGSEKDKSDGEEILKKISDKEKVLNTCGNYTLNQSASLVKQAKLILTNDTGLMHIASAFGKKIIAFFGSTVPEFGMSPYSLKEKSIVFENKNLGCRPCSKLGFENCPKKHFKCMNDLDVDQIVACVKT